MTPEGVPTLRRPVLVAAFEGWNDAGDAATDAVEHLAEQWGAVALAELDPDDYYDFQVNRPTVSLVDGLTRSISWPTTRVFTCRPPDGERVRGSNGGRRRRSGDVDGLRCRSRQHQIHFRSAQTRSSFAAFFPNGKLRVDRQVRRPHRGNKNIPHRDRAARLGGSRSAAVHILLLRPGTKNLLARVDVTN